MDHVVTGHGLNTLSLGNAGEGLVCKTCMELIRSQTPRILLLGGSPNLAADLILEGADVIYVHQDEMVLEYFRMHVDAFLAHSESACARFRTECRAFKDDLSDLFADASIIVCAGWLHHTADPGSLLAQMMKTPAPLVVLDMTVEHTLEVINEEIASHGCACDAHYSCCDNTKRVGWNIQGDIERFIAASISPPSFFCYRITCIWCNDVPCEHRGTEYWFMLWDKMPLQVD